MSALSVDQAIEMMEQRTTEAFQDYMNIPETSDAVHANGVIVGLCESLVYLRHTDNLTEDEFEAYISKEYEDALYRYQNWVATGKPKPNVVYEELRADYPERVIGIKRKVEYGEDPE